MKRVVLALSLGGVLLAGCGQTPTSPASASNDSLVTTPTSSAYAVSPPAYSPAPDTSYLQRQMDDKISQLRQDMEQQRTADEADRQFREFQDKMLKHALCSSEDAGKGLC